MDAGACADRERSDLDVDERGIRRGLHPTFERARRQRKVDLDVLVFTRVVPVLLVLALVLYDLRRRGRPHVATAAGLVLLWIGLPVLRSWVPVTTVGREVVLLFS